MCHFALSAPHEGNGFHVVVADLPIQRGTRVYEVDILEVFLLCVLSASHVGIIWYFVFNLLEQLKLKIDLGGYYVVNRKN